ncbi:hypothetical protein KIPB_013633 [Kipferlia bialata]|uniref:Uncharacterized protein n=1 Tax=Kipferlia bialata TaxID=797122 RepID=A0A9K3GPT4_9EUKA|nr:hypothetical protein KIPB_013633 [Kipferlia bialata]|eukprot:g13633.t1
MADGFPASFDRVSRNLLGLNPEDQQSEEEDKAVKKLVEDSLSGYSNVSDLVIKALLVAVWREKFKYALLVAVWREKFKYVFTDTYA